MSITNRKINGTNGISIPDVREVLNEHTNDLGRLCRSTKINKWAKNKPVSRPSVKRLTAAERIGTTGERAEGYFYGVKIGAYSGNLLDIQNTDFTYSRPTGGASSPYRLMDFDGYDHYAVPTLNGSIPEKGYYNKEKSVDISINFDATGSNTTGIDIGMIIAGADATQTQKVNAVKNLYPCILLVTDDSAKQAFVCACKDYATNQPSKLYSSYWVEHFYIDPNLCDAINTTAKSYRAYVFLTDSLTHGSYDFSDWVTVTGQRVDVGEIYAVVGACGEPLVLERYANSFVPVLGGVTEQTISASGSWSLIASLSPQLESGQSIDVTLNVGRIVDNRVVAPISRTITFTSGVNGSRKMQSFTMSDFLIDPVANTTYVFRASMTYDGSSDTRDFSIRINES